MTEAEPELPSSASPPDPASPSCSEPPWLTPAAPPRGVALPAAPPFAVPAFESGPEEGEGLLPHCSVAPAQPTISPPSTVFRQMARISIGRAKHGAEHL